MKVAENQSLPIVVLMSSTIKRHKTIGCVDIERFNVNIISNCTQFKRNKTEEKKPNKPTEMSKNEDKR